MKIAVWTFRDRDMTTLYLWVSTIYRQLWTSVPTTKAPNQGGLPISKIHSSDRHDPIYNYSLYNIYLLPNQLNPHHFLKRGVLSSLLLSPTWRQHHNHLHTHHYHYFETHNCTRSWRGCWDDTFARLRLSCPSGCSSIPPKTIHSCSRLPATQWWNPGSKSTETAAQGHALPFGGLLSSCSQVGQLFGSSTDCGPGQWWSAG